MISKRLENIIFLVPSFSKYIADIGSDHGLVPLCLLDKGYKVFASDNKIGPFNTLKSVLKDKENIVLSLSSGLDELPFDVDTVIISGMGGNIILDILKKGNIHFSHIAYFIISPHSLDAQIRKYLLDNNYKIDREIFLKEDNIYYVMMLFIKGKQDLSPLEIKFGPCILKEKNKDFQEYIKEKIDLMNNLLKNKNLTLKRRKELENELKLYEEAL